VIDRRARTLKDRVLEPLAARLAAHVTGGFLTGVSLALAVAAAGAAWAGSPPLAVGCWLTSRLADGLDGPVARRRGEAGDLGGYLDILADTVGYTIIPVAVALGVDDRATWIALAALLGILYVNAISWTYLAAVLEKRGAGARHSGEATSITMPPALVEGAETIVLFTLFLALPGRAAWIFGLMAALVTVNIGQRLWWAWRSLDRAPALTNQLAADASASGVAPARSRRTTR